jgi:2-haloacid dehalogenase
MPSDKKAGTSTKSAIQALVFDAYGTLFDVSSVATALDQLFPGQGAALSAAWRAKQLQYTWLRALSGQYEDFWKVTESALVFTCNDMKLHAQGGLQVQPAPVQGGLQPAPVERAVRAKLMDAYLHLEPFPEVKQALQSLSAQRLAILSNGTPAMLQDVVENAGLKKVFSQILSADEAKTYKPNPAVYELAVGKLGLDKGKIGFVSSNFWDVAGAKAFGFRTYWVNRSGAPEEELGVRPDVTLRSLSDLRSDSF